MYIGQAGHSGAFELVGNNVEVVGNNVSLGGSLALSSKINPKVYTRIVAHGKKPEAKPRRTANNLPSVYSYRHVTTEKHIFCGMMLGRSPAQHTHPEALRGSPAGGWAALDGPVATATHSNTKDGDIDGLLVGDII